jgi:hypothetical protein
LAYHEVDVSGTHRVPIDGLEELVRRAVCGERVGGGPKAVEPVLALVVGLELAAEVVVCERRVLEIVLAVAAGLPHVEGDVGDRLVGNEIADDAVHVGDLTLVVVLDDRVAELAPGSVGRPEGTEDSGGGGLVVGVVGFDVVGDLSDKAGLRISCQFLTSRLSMAGDLRFKTNKVTHPVHLVALAVRLGPGLADLIEESHTLQPFFGCEVNLACEVVQVSHGGSVDFQETWAGVGAACVDDVLCEVLVVLVGGRGCTGLRLRRHGGLWH